MAEPSYFPLAYHFGDSFQLSIQWTGKDLIGYSAAMQVRDEATWDLKLSLATGGSGMQIQSNAAGDIVLVNASPTRMLDGDLVEGATYVYDLQVKSSDGSIVATLARGPFRVDRQVTVV